MRTVRFWVATVAAIVGIAVTGSLGLWQWGRAQQKLALQAAIEARAQGPEVPVAELAALADSAAPASELLHRPVALRGQWIAGRTVFLDNRQMAGRQGFYVVTPLKLAEGGAVVLVQRGWAPRNFNDRAALPPVDTPAGEVEVRGRLAPPPAQLYAFDAEERGAIRQNLDLGRFRLETGLALLPLSVQQTGAPSEGLLRDWPPVASGADKNYGYAFQWWSFAALIAILYVWFQFVAPRRQVRRA